MLFAEQQYYIQPCTQVNQTVIPTSERTSLLFAVYLALSGLVYTPLTKVSFPFFMLLATYIHSAYSYNEP